MKVKLDDGAHMPTRAHDGDAGLDLYSPINAVVPARDALTIDIGVHVQIPKRCWGYIAPRSGLMSKLKILTSGVIDCGYTGRISVTIFNLGCRPFLVTRGKRIAQLIVVPYLPVNPEEVDELEATERGDGGFGSTGE